MLCELLVVKRQIQCKVKCLKNNLSKHQKWFSMSSVRPFIPRTLQVMKHYVINLPYHLINRNACVIINTTTSLLQWTTNSYWKRWKDKQAKKVSSMMMPPMLQKLNTQLNHESIFIKTISVQFTWYVGETTHDSTF